MFTMLQHTALAAFLLKMKYEWFLDEKQSLRFLTFRPSHQSMDCGEKDNLELLS